MLVGWGLVCVLIHAFAYPVGTWLRARWFRWRARRAATPLPPIIPEPTNEQLLTEAAKVEHAVQSRRAHDYVQRYAEDLLADGVSPADAIREAREMWDDINRIG